ncbi:MAG: hypothetical protein AAGG55_10300 [Pseudomonadota bacterium]
MFSGVAFVAVVMLVGALVRLPFGYHAQRLTTVFASSGGDSEMIRLLEWYI